MEIVQNMDIFTEDNLNKDSFDATTWNEIVSKLNFPHLLQTYQWGLLKSDFGWQPLWKVWQDSNNIVAAALILEKSITFGGYSTPFKILYVPKGPLLRDWQDINLIKRVFSDLKSIGKKKKAIFIKIDPDIIVGTSTSNDYHKLSRENLGELVIQEMKAQYWIYSPEQIQFRNTMILDLTRSEDDLLIGMKQKTRYNIRLAEKRGVSIRDGNILDIPLLYQMYAETSLRDNFALRDQTYYQKVWGLFIKNINNLNIQDPVYNLGMKRKISQRNFCNPSAKILIAEVNHEPIAAVVCYHYAGRAWYFYGMSKNSHREKMPNHLLQWVAILRAKQDGCKVYDFWGAPEIFDQSDPLYGLFRFKSGFGGQYIRNIGAWDYPIMPIYYQLYIKILPHILAIMRLKGRKLVRKHLEV